MRCQSDWWGWECTRCGWQVRSEYTVNPQQVIAETLVLLHTRQHEQDAAINLARPPQGEDA